MFTILVLALLLHYYYIAGRAQTAIRHWYNEGRRTTDALVRGRGRWQLEAGTVDLDELYISDQMHA